MAADPEDHRCLLARARLRQDDPESQIKDALEAVRLAPSFAEGHLFLAQVFCKLQRTDSALDHLAKALSQLPQQRELTPAFVDTAMAIARAGQIERVSALLILDDYGATMEPLIVALKLKRGDSPIVAKEVLEVARDIAASANRPKKT
jgi:tetratricopeptide (TPR) repeat protein